MNNKLRILIIYILLFFDHLRQLIDVKFEIIHPYDLTLKFIITTIVCFLFLEFFLKMKNFENKSITPYLIICTFSLYIMFSNFPILTQKVIQIPAIFIYIIEASLLIYLGYVFIKK